MITIVPAAGRSERYKAEGIETPKPLIRFAHRILSPDERKCMIHYVIHNSVGYTYVVCPSSQEREFREAYVYNPLVTVEEETRGQADTIYQALEQLNDEGTASDEAVLVVNSDQGFAFSLKGFVAEAEARDLDCAVLGFQSTNPAYGYVDGQVFDGGFEKPNLHTPAWALAGAFYFESSAALRVALHERLARFADGEPYLSQCLSDIKGNKQVIPMYEWQLYPWGTPQDLRNDPNVTELDL